MAVLCGIAWLLSICRSQRFVSSRGLLGGGGGIVNNSEKNAFKLTEVLVEIELGECLDRVEILQRGGYLDLNWSLWR